MDANINENTREKTHQILASMMERTDLVFDSILLLEHESAPARSKMLHGGHAVSYLQELISLSSILIQLFNSTSNGLYAVLTEIAHQARNKNSKDNTEQKTPIGFHPSTADDKQIPAIDIDAIIQALQSMSASVKKQDQESGNVAPSADPEKTSPK